MTNLNTTVATKLNIRESAKLNPPTVKQLAWLNHAVKDYSLGLDVSSIATIAEASRHIGVIQVKITNKVITKTVVQKTWYAVIANDTVSIKSFGGTFKEASAKASAIYGQIYVNVVTSNLEFARKKAITLRDSIVANVAQEIETEVAKTETVLNDSITSDLTQLSLDELVAMAQEFGVKLGNSKKPSTIIARILAKVA